MPDNLRFRKPLDATRINIHQQYEVDYWCNELGCTRQQLGQAVHTVGTSANAVKRHLSQQNLG